MSERCDPGGSRRPHAGDQQFRLPVEQLQHLALQATVAKCDAGKVNEIDRPVVRREGGRVFGVDPAHDVQLHGGRPPVFVPAVSGQVMVESGTQADKAG